MYTKGPWKTVKPGHGHETEYLCVQIGEDDSYTTLEVKQADAILMAAAPEMLQALMMIEGDPALTPSASEIITAAIRKATRPNRRKTK